MNNTPKIVVAEMYYPEGHRLLNVELIEILSTFTKITIIDDGAYFNKKKLRSKVDRWIKVNPIILKRIEVLKTLSHIYNLIQISVKLRKVYYDKIIFFSVNNLALYFSLPFFKSDKIIVIHHYDIDRTLSRPIELKIFKRFMNKISHVVLSDFIKSGLEEKVGINSNKVFVVNQPFINKNAELKIKNDRSKIFIGLGRNNSEEFIRKLLELDKYYTVGKLKYHIIIRSKNISYKGNNLTVINDYLTREQYDDFLNTSSACIVTYPETYKLRYSGVIDDALSHGMIVILNDIPISKYFASLYPNNCLIIKSAEDLWNLAKNDLHSLNENEFNSFINSRKIELIKEQLESVIES